MNAFYPLASAFRFRFCLPSHQTSPVAPSCHARALAAAEASANGATGASDMVGNAARVAVERSGSLPRCKAETSDIEHQGVCGPFPSFLIHPSNFLLLLLFSALS
jgi:hypothetical protein